MKVRGCELVSARLRALTLLGHLLEYRGGGLGPSVVRYRARYSELGECEDQRARTQVSARLRAALEALTGVGRFRELRGYARSFSCKVKVVVCEQVSARLRAAQSVGPDHLPNSRALCQSKMKVVVCEQMSARLK